MDYAPTVVGDTVYVAGTDVLAHSTIDGSELRRFETGGEVEHVAVDERETGDAMYASSDAVYAFR